MIVRIGLNVYGHRLFGPLPECSTYLCHWEFDIGRITGEIKPSFLLGLSCFGQSFAYNLIDEDNAVPQEMESKDLPDVSFVKLYVQEVDVCLMSMNSATNISLKDGILLEFDNLINAKYSQRITIKVPAILTRCLANPDQARGDTSIESNEYSWVEIAKADLGLNVTIFRHTAVWKKARSEQQNYIRAQDYPTRRCVRLYEEADTASQSKLIHNNINYLLYFDIYFVIASHSSMHSTNEHHVGILYAPPFRPFMFGRVEDKSILHDSRSYTSGAPSPESARYAGYGSNGSINTPSDMLMQSESDDDEDDSSDFEFDDELYDNYSIRSGISTKDNESFHTAKNSDEEDEQEDTFSIADEYSINSRDYSDITSDDDAYTSSTNQQNENKNHRRNPEKNLKAAIPPSIPYSDYLRRYKLIRPNSEFNHGGFFHPFIPPSQPHFVPEKGNDENYRPLYETSGDEDNNDYFSNEADHKKHSDSNIENADAYGKGNEVIATTVIEATRPVTVLVTPILVKLVQELAEEIIKDDWDLETMLDALQMEYIEQLTRYLTDQYICTRFAVILPQTYLHFIQNATVPDDLPSYKHGESFVKTQYNPEDTILCSADIFLNDFRMIGSVKFEDYAFDEKKKKVAESNMVLQESRVHIDVGDMGSTVQYVSKQYEQQSIAFGIPYESLRNKNLYTNMDDQEALVDELVMLDLAVKGFSFKWLGARTPNYAELTLDSVDTIIITESVEILVGAVYSWLVFVDDLKGILESFQDQRTRQVQVFINEIANYSITQGVVGDPVFLTTPTTMLRLGSRNFRNDCGWKLLARMRHCLRSMPSSRREELQYRLTSGGALQGIDSEAMYANVVHTFSHWRNWEVGYTDITHCRLFTQPFNQNVAQDGGKVVPKNMTDEVVRFLISSANFAKAKLGEFKFTIYEEETCESSKEENSISIGPFEFLLECLFKASAISSVPEHHQINNDNHKILIVPDGYLDIITKINLGEINISTNPIILAFARHMLLVQKVFTAKLLSLSHANKTSQTTPNSSNFAANATNSSTLPDTVVVGNHDFDFDALLAKVDIVAQALVSLDKIQVIAHAHELRMDTVVSGVQGSALFSNPKLAPLQLFSHTERDSDTGSGKRSSNRGRRNANAEPRLVLEAAGGINMIDIKFREELQHNNNSKAIPNNILLGIMLEKANVNANISQIPKLSKKHSKYEITKDVLNVFSNIHKFHIHVPQSLLRLYGFVESWQTEQGRRYHFMFQNLIKEWEEQRGAQSSSNTPAAIDMTDAPFSNATPTATSNPLIPTKKMDIKLQFLLNEFSIQADLLPSLSFEYSILDFFIMVNETHHKSAPIHMYAFQLSKQVVHLITKDDKKHKHNNSSSAFSIPGIRSTGSIKNELVKGVLQIKLRSMISIDLISMSLDASLIDSLLTAQSLVGNEVSELVEVLSYSKNKNPPIIPLNETPISPVSPSRVFKYCIDISLDGLQVSASSPSALGMFSSNLLEASISNDNLDGQEATDQLSWKLQARNFSLSLVHNTVEDIDDTLINKEDAVYQRNCLAYILVDFSVQNYLPTCTTVNCQKGTHAHACDNNKQTGALFIDFSRIQTVMQPIALGKLAEMYIYYDAELGKKKLQKKAEIDQLSANTKRIVQSISNKNEWPKTLQEEHQSLLEGKTISLHIRRLGVAIPLNSQSDLPSSSSSSTTPTENPRGVSALLLSVVSIEFMTKNIEKSALQLDNLAVQFVKRFDQNKAEHFIAENHPRMNQISLPSISCHVSASKVKPLQSIIVDAHVKGFEIDVDGTIADYVNTLSIIYVKSKDRVDAFTTKANFNLTKNTAAAATTPELDSPSTSEVIHLNVECKFECDSGTIRMYPKRHSSDAQRNKRKLKTLRIRTGFDPKSNEGNMATVELPGLSAWLIYQTPLGAHAKVIDAPKRFHADILIRESVNTLHPALVQFLREVTAGLKLGIQQSSERKADRPATSENESNLNASLFLRLSRTQLDLSCQPTSKVVCSLGWEESEFMMNAFSKDTTSRTISCVGSVREITAMVKHHFSPEACLNARIDRILFNVILTSQREGGDLKDDISVIIELPNILGDLNMRHLQDLLILNTCWFAQPIDVHNNTPRSPKSPTSAINLKASEKPTSIASTSDNEETAIEHLPAPFSKHIAVCIQSMKFSVDLGQNIGRITLMPNALSFQLHHVPHETKGLSLSLEEIKVISEGRLSGKAEFSSTVVQGRVDQSFVNGHIKEKSSICVRLDGFNAAFEYEYQNILDAIQQSLELNVDLQRDLNIYELQVSINLDALIARLSVKTVPVIITMVQRFNELLKKKKAEAGIRSDDYETDNSKATIIVLNDLPKKEEKQNNLYENSSVQSQVNLCIKAVEVVIYPSQFQDSDNVDIRAKQFKVDLEELPRTEEGVHRKLVITLISAALAKNVPGKELMVRYSAPLPPPGSKLKNLGGTKIFGIPGTEISMESTQLDRQITHEFGTNFAGRISVSLNIGLIKYLQEMINMFNLQLDRALEKDKLHITPEPSTPLSISSSNNNFEDVDDHIINRRKASLISNASNSTTTTTPANHVQVEDTEKKEETTKQEKEINSPANEKYTYKSINSVSFQPQLQVMGDATPPVEWLGLKRERIPGLVHENITLPLDQIVKVIWGLLESQAD